MPADPVPADPMSCGAVLCGGASRRMGRDKAFVEYDGVAMVQRVMATLRAAGCAEVVAVGGDARQLAALGLRCIPDEHPGEGPLGGVITALHHFADREAVMVVACDLPRLTPATVSRVLGALTERDATEVVMAVTDRREPLCAAWRPTVADALVQAFEAGERRLQTAVQPLRIMELPVPVTDLANVNTPTDLHQ